MSSLRLWLITFVALAVAVATDLALGTSPPGWVAVLGFGGCWLIVVGSKWFGKRLLQRPEAYWAETDHPEVRDGA
jgi:hypothetical protein